MKLTLYLCVAIFLACSTANAVEPPQLTISLKDAEASALTYSGQVQSSDYDRRAADARALALSSQTSPQLTFDASYHYYSQVPQLVLPGGFARALGANNVYSIGPTLTYLLYDAGGARHSIQSAKLIARAKSEQTRATRDNVLLATRSAYFAVQNSAERMRLIIDSLRLSQARYSDIARRLSAGAASRADALSAHKDVLDFGLQLRQAQADLAADLADLLALVGRNTDYDITRPVAAAEMPRYPPELGAPTVLVNLDPLQKTLERFLSMRQQLDLTGNPQVVALSDLANASRLASKSYSNQRLPKIELSARTSLDYPNGPVLERINQNTIGVTLSMPLFDDGRISALAREQILQAGSLDSQRAQLTTDLARDWNKAAARLSALRGQETIAHQGAKETARLAQLVYESYRVGRDRYLDVQTANLDALNWKVNLALIKSQILVQLAVQASLSSRSSQ
ncbi:MAG: TolC family protein [Acidiferrobacterales bacterium]